MALYLRTPKVRIFNNLINWMNTNASTDFTFIFADTSSILDNGWLAGFLDADGSFQIQVREKAADGVTEW